jgi:hypothetical protein
MIAYYYSLLLGLLGSFIGTFLPTIGIGLKSPLRISRWRHQSKFDFTAYASNVRFAYIITKTFGFTLKELVGQWEKDCGLSCANEEMRL